MKGHILGLPRIGADRELKKSLEDYWKSGITLSKLLETGKSIRKENIGLQVEAGLDYITVGDFSFYDQVLDTTVMIGNIPERFRDLKLTEFNRYFSIARGITVDNEMVYPGDMRKYFNTNYHYIVPEIDRSSNFRLNSSKIIGEIREAIDLGISPNRIKPVLIGPGTYLWLSKGELVSKKEAFPKIKAIYDQLIEEISLEGVEWLQIDEPILSLDTLTSEYSDFLTNFYNKSRSVKLLLTTYFDSIDDNLSIVDKLRVDGIHLDLTQVYSSKLSIPDFIRDIEVETLSLGVLNSRNIWCCDLESIAKECAKLEKELDKDILLAPSSSLQYLPVTKESEELPEWISFAKERVGELKSLLDYFKLPAIEGSFTRNSRALQVLKEIRSLRKGTYSVLDSDTIGRKSSYGERSKIQHNTLSLPDYPTTTIGSFPQTKEVRSIRNRWRKGFISNEEYTKAITEEIESCIRVQEEIGLDVLVHGEFERTDMVEYFAEYIEGYLTTKNGWVQSYGSRCVKPGIVYCDLERREAITTNWTKVAQGFTQKMVKGMLTGPVTMLKWSFVRDDIPFETTLEQMSLEIGKEVKDLEKSGIKIIQVDEAALKEGLPLKRRDREYIGSLYSKAFRITTSNLLDETQIHTHMCYSDFKDILDVIEDMDADVITIECSRSNMTLLSDFADGFYLNSIGPGVYDIHSPNIPNREEIKRLATKALEFIPKEKLWINPDCGLKTRAWSETKASLKNMVAVARELRLS